jgi:hypothetical protein
VTPAEFDQRRAFLEDLLSRRHLWPWQVTQVAALAEELGIEVVIYDKPLVGGEWKVRNDDEE